MSYSSEVLADSPLAYYRLDDAPATVAAAAASSSFSSEPAANAFDGSATTYWTTNGTMSGWLRAQLSAAVAETSYSIRRRDDIPTRNPKDWTFEGSNDGTTWTVLDTQTGITWPTSGETKTFTFTNSAYYLYYRINVSATNGTSSDPYLSIAELKLSKMAASTTMADSSGNSRPGTYTATSGNPAPGSAQSLLTSDATDAALALNGTQYATVPYAAWQSPTSFTVEALVKPSSISGAQVIVSRNGPTTGTSTFTFRMDSGVVKLYVWTSTSTLISASAPITLAVGTAYHVVGTYDGTTAKVYVNATVGTNATGTMYNGATNQLIIGSEGSGASLWQGTVDEVAFYGTALSATRITAHYNAATATPASATVNAVAATATASVPAPVVGAGATVTAVAATATASVPAPIATGTGSATVSAVAATATADVVAPSIIADANVAGSAAAAIADVLTPTVAATSSATVYAVAATATADVLAPNYSDGSGSVTVTAVAAAATASVLPPVWTQVLDVGTDTTNAFDGLDVVCRASVTVTVPTATAPPSLAPAERVDKAIPYPVPVLVNGRPT